jgi:hypothetical protein
MYATTSGFSVTVPPRTLDPILSLNPLLGQLRARYGPYIISPPAGRSAPVAIILPSDVRYCSECNDFKPRDQMRYDEICAACAGPPPSAPKRLKPKAKHANNTPKSAGREKAGKGKVKRRAEREGA